MIVSDILVPLWHDPPHYMREGEARIFAYDLMGKALEDLTKPQQEELRVWVALRLLAEKWARRK